MINTAAPTDLLEGLNEDQREAILHTEGALLINAGPGAGKTLVLTRRIANILNSTDVSPQRICAVTFTNKAAGEMQTRIRPLAGEDASSLTIGTFHSLCARILRTYGDHIGITGDFVIYDDTDTKQTLKRILKDVLDETPDPGILDAATGAISTAKNLGLTSETADMDADLKETFARYEEALWRSDALDFDDLLARTTLLLDNSPPVADRLASRYVHVMIDEFQDASAMQYRIAARLAAVYRNLCAVGDPDQSIYGWRQSDITNFLTFREEFPERREIMLQTNYRSSGAVIDTASQLMRSATYPQGYGRKNLTGIKEAGEKVLYAASANEDEEAEMIIDTIGDLRDSYELSDMAVCYRTNAQSRALEAACSRAEMPYRVVGGPKFYQRAEIKDVMCYLRLLANPHDDMSLIRVINTPRRGIGAASLSKLLNFSRAAGISAYKTAADPMAIADAGIPKRAGSSLAEFTETIDWLTELMNEPDASLSEVASQLVHQTGYREHIAQGTDDRAEDRLENIDELLAQTQTIQSENGAAADLARFIEQVSLDSDNPEAEAALDRLTLTTIHQTKGMEWPVVIVAGMNEGTLPHQRSLDDGDVEEERRLCYVATTRAMDRLIFTRPLTRRMTGPAPQKESRFIKEMNLARTDR